MSYQTWHEYGYGICADDIETTLERIERLLDLAPSVKDDIYAWFTDCAIEHPSVEDYCEWDQDYFCGLATILRMVIERDCGVTLIACTDYDGGCYLLYPPRYPWCMAPGEELRTEESVADIFRHYINILTDQPVDIDYYSVENGG